jgi:hypothetical protein
MRKVALGFAWILGLYLVIRGIAELFMLDWGNPASYANDWGGPSLVGVLAIHSGPGLVAATIMIIAIVRGRARARRLAAADTTTSPKL